MDVIQSSSRALVFFSCVRAVLFFSLEISPVLMFNGTSAGGGSENWLGDGLFNSDSKINASSTVETGSPFSLRVSQFTTN